MPNIRPSDEDVSLDTFRQNPGGIFFLSHLAKAKVVTSYDGFKRALKRTGVRTLRVGRQEGIEGRDALRLVGAPATVPDHREPASAQPEAA